MTKLYVDVDTAIDTELAAEGCNDIQRTDCLLALRRDLYIKDGIVTYSNSRMKTPVDGLIWPDPKIIAYLRETRPHSFPSKVEESLAERAFAGRGNLRARADLIAEVGQKEADRVAREWGLRNTFDTRHGRAPEGSEIKPRDSAASNPWSSVGWSITKQGQICKSLGIEKAAALARAAGSYVGATKPAK